MLLGVKSGTINTTQSRLRCAFVEPARTHILYYFMFFWTNASSKGYMVMDPI